MSIGETFPKEMWVFYPAATQEELIEYTIWCHTMLGYVPFMNNSIVIFKSAEDTVLFRLVHADLL